MPLKAPTAIDLTAVGRSCFPHEQDKRHRRIIANSNERRRMQSINAGFQMLKNLIGPQDGEKLSKASVLQQAVERIRRLEMEKAFLQAENKRLEHLVCHSRISSTGYDDDDAPVTKHKKIDSESSDEGVSMMAAEEPLAVGNLRRQLVELRQRLECEHQTHSLLEQQQLHLVTDRYASRPTDSFSGIGLRYSASAPTEDARLCGSLETIVEAIQHLEGAQADSPPMLTKSDSFIVEDDIDPDDDLNSAHSTMFLNSSSSLQLPTTELMRVVAAAEVLQCFSKRHKAMNRRPQPPFPCILQPMRSSVGSKLCHKLIKSQQYFHNT